MKPELFYAVKPFHINQAFGANKDYYLSQFGTNGHMGIDFQAGHGQPVYAAQEGEAFYIKDSHGGEGCYIETDVMDYTTLAGSQVQAKYQIINWHLIGDTDPNFPCPIPMGGVRTKVKAGDLIGYADNTGAPFESSGDHLHFGLRPVNTSGVMIELNNKMDGCIDPQPFFNHYFAQDAQTVYTALHKIIDLLQNFLSSSAKM